MDIIKGRGEETYLGLDFALKFPDSSSVIVSGKGRYFLYPVRKVKGFLSEKRDSGRVRELRKDISWAVYVQ